MERRVKSYRDLVVWQKAMDMAVAVYRVSDMFPDRERFGLTIQVRKSGVSVPSNIAEGQARASTREFLHHLSIARGSLAETETHLLVALRVEYITKAHLREAWDLIQDVGKLLNRLMQSLERGEKPGLGSSSTSR